MASNISICNLALGWLGSSLISDFPPGDTSAPATLCHVNFEPARDKTLEDRDWSFASARQTLTPLVASPDHGYSTAFQIPSNTITIRDVSAKPFTHQPEDNLSWTRERDQILSDVSTVYVRYTIKETDPNKFSAGFIHACAARIAVDIAIAITGSKDMRDLMEKAYIELIETGGAIDGLQGVNKTFRSNKLTGIRSGLHFDIFKQP